MDKDFDMDEEKPRVSNEDCNGDDLNSNAVNRDSSGYEMGVGKSEIDQIRVLSGEGSEGRVLGGYHANGDSKEVDGVRVSLTSDEIDGDGKIIVKGENLELSNVDIGKNEMMKPETSGISGTEKSREVEEHENDKGKPKASGSGRKGKLGLSSGNDFGGEVYSEAMRKDVRKGEVSYMDVRDGDFKLERRGDSGAPMNRSFFSIDVDDSVMRSVSAKVLGTEFEMGDMVWGKVKSHPWWPGHLYNEAFASSSVRRTRRDGHILVAFFGDSSYGWFDPDDLVPYDPHYGEKSQQTSSRNFVRAVEESVDEASRRSALGLSCYCRNPFNFRPTNIPGYLAVDIVDFEPGTVYSVSQIQKARDSLRPAETLSFIHQLATASMGSDIKSLDFVKNKAIALAYRRSIFEEFDETYAEAFGHKPVRPDLPRASTVKEPSRAPLSGPLVFADTLGVRKSSTKATKPKEQSKKDKYLFKRRDESYDTRTSTMTQGDASPSTSSAYEDETSNSATGGYVFQKRDQAASYNELVESPAIDQLAASAYAVTSEDGPTGRNLTAVPQHSISDEAGTADTGDVRRVSDKPISIVSSSDAGNFVSSSNLLKKKKKAAKRPASELSSWKLEPQEKKVKKSKKAENFRSSEHSERHSTVSGGVSPVNSVGRPTQVVASTIDNTQVSQSEKDVEVTNSVPQEVGLVPLAVDWENEADVHQILADLHDLAQNPFHGMERNGPAVARQFFLKFRSLVFLKSSCASATAESEHGEARVARSLGPETADRAPTESSKTVSSLKPPKVSARPDDPTKGGRKRIPSERQEENAAKRAKKITEVKSLSSEKRAQLKNPELQQPDGKPKVASAQNPQSKPVKVEQHGKKADRPPRVEEPTYLVMKYQSDSNLPSHTELKARFARFGPLDTSLSRVFYKTYTCRVAFLYKQDAHVAYRYAVGSKSLFSNVRFMLKPVAGPESQQPVTGKTEDLNGEPRLNPNPSTIESRPTTLAVLPQPVQPLKSCLKKPSGGDESGVPSNGGGGSRTTRVRFNVGEENSASNRGGLQVQLMESRNPVLASKEGAPSSSSSTSIAVDINNNQRLLSPHPLQAPLLPLPQFVRPPINHQYNHSEMAPRNNFQENLTTTTPATTTTSVPGLSQALPPPLPPPPPPNADISQQMMSLLTRCHDVVTNLKSILGYVPYHSL